MPTDIDYTDPHDLLPHLGHGRGVYFSRPFPQDGQMDDGRANHRSRHARSRTAQLLDTVYSLARKAELPAMPEVGIYRSNEVNAFATGPTRSRALVAVSTGLLKRMKEE